MDAHGISINLATVIKNHLSHNLGVVSSAVADNTTKIIAGKDNEIEVTITVKEKPDPENKPAGSKPEDPEKPDTE